MATPETPKENQGENYETIKLILEDIKQLKGIVDQLKIRISEALSRITTIEHNIDDW